MMYRRCNQFSFECIMCPLLSPSRSEPSMCAHRNDSQHCCFNLSNPPCSIYGPFRGSQSSFCILGISLSHGYRYHRDIPPYYRDVSITKILLLYGYPYYKHTSPYNSDIPSGRGTNFLVHVLFVLLFLICWDFCWRRPWEVSPFSRREI